MVGFLAGESFQLFGLVDDVRGQEDEQFGFGVFFDFPPKRPAKEGDVSQQRHFADGFPLVAFHEAADDDGFAVAGDHHGFGGTFGKDGVFDVVADANGFVGSGGNFRGDDHFHKAVGSDERSDGQNDANVFVFDGVDLVALVGDARVADKGDFFADGDGSFLVVAGEDGRAGENFEVARFGHCARGDGEVGV